MVNTLQSPGATPAAHDPVGEMFILEHSYKLIRRLSVGSFYSTYEARQRPFDRLVHVRIYHKIHELGLSEKALERLRSRLEAGADGNMVADFGEIPSGAPFIVLRPPRGRGLAQWWSKSKQDGRTLAELVVAIIGGLDGLTEAQRAELTIDRVYVTREAQGPPVVDLYCLGDHPTRAEVREMSHLIQRDLVLGFPPECFLPSLAAQDDIERQESADAYRLAAILYQLATGEHPVFPRLVDVADSVAALIHDHGRKLKPVGTGWPAMDSILIRCLGTDPAQRPSLQTFKDLATQALEPPRAPAESSGPTPAPIAELRRTGSRLPAFLRWFLLALALVAAAGGTYLWTQRPVREAAVLITSDPSGVRFQRIRLDGRTEIVGETPLLLLNEDIASPLQLQPLYEDGRAGEVQRLTPDQFEMLDACRSLHIQFEPSRRPPLSDPGPGD